MEPNSQRDQQLWKIAQARAKFKTSLIIYLVTNAFLWAVWLATRAYEHGGTPWPVWPGIGWGLALAFQYFNAWHRDPTGDAVREYEKLQEEKQRKGI